MAYFPNETSFEFYEAEYCQHCVNNTKKGEDHYCCPIQTLHLLFNYEECSKEDSFLHMLIPRDGIENKECTMFRVSDPERCTETKDMFG